MPRANSTASGAQHRSARRLTPPHKRPASTAASGTPPPPNHLSPTSSQKGPHEHPRTTQRSTNPGRRFSAPHASLCSSSIVAAGAFFVARQDGVSTALSFTNGVRGSGVAATQTRTVPSFGAIDLTGSSSVRVHVGPRQTVVINADDNLIDRVTTEVRDGVLVVSERGSFSTNSPLSVDVTVPTLTAVGLIGSGTINVVGVTARTFTAELPGSGLLTVSGTTDQLDATLAGSGNMHLGKLTARSVTATVPGSGTRRVPPPTRSMRRYRERTNRLQRTPEDCRADRDRLGRHPAPIRISARRSLAPGLGTASGRLQAGC